MNVESVEKISGIVMEKNSRTAETPSICAYSTTETGILVIALEYIIVFMPNPQINTKKSIAGIMFAVPESGEAIVSPKIFPNAGRPTSYLYLYINTVTTEDIMLGRYKRTLKNSLKRYFL